MRRLFFTNSLQCLNISHDEGIVYLSCDLSLSQKLCLWFTRMNRWSSGSLFLELYTMNNVYDQCRPDYIAFSDYIWLSVFNIFDLIWCYCIPFGSVQSLQVSIGIALTIFLHLTNLLCLSFCRHSLVSQRSQWSSTFSPLYRTPFSYCYYLWSLLIFSTYWVAHKVYWAVIC